MQEPQNYVIVTYHLGTLLHRSSRIHPQCPQRVTNILQYLKTNPIKNAQLIQITQNNSQQSLSLIRLVHGLSYQEFVREMWPQGISKSQLMINIDTYFMTNSYKSALNGVITVVKTVNMLNKSKYGFVIVRPPGHHAGMKSQPHGFSFFNNVACGVYQALQLYPKVAIIDWDAHHGEGTQHIFRGRKDVLFISIHRYDNGNFFPHIKQSDSSYIGQGQGQGFNVNIGWNLPEKGKGEARNANETCGDNEYIYCMHRVIMPILTSYEPNIIFISCGFDSAEGDPIGALNMTPISYAYITQQLMSLNKPIIAVLEGGYNPAVLQKNASTVISTLAGSTQFNQSISKAKQNNKPNKIGQQGVNKCVNSIEKYWKIQPQQKFIIKEVQ